MSRARVKIKILPQAVREVAEQAEYYRREANDALAARWRKAVNEAIRSLRQFAERVAKLELRSTVVNLRKLHIEGFPGHLIFYRWDAEINTVMIVSVIHGARDFESLNFE